MAFPTETVYGLGARADRDEAVARIFAAKGRPSFDPLIAHLPGLAEAEEWALFDDRARRLAREFWPGPLTLVLPRRAGGVSDLCTSGLPTVGVRVPDHPLALALLRACGLPVAAPSANPFGYVSPTTAEHVRSGLGDRVDAVLDGGACRVGVESTIVDLAGEVPRLLRPGGIPREALEAALGTPLAYTGHLPAVEHPQAPGMLESHYAPGARVECFATREGLASRAADLAGECALLGQDLPEVPCRIREDLGTGDLAMATGLFRALRSLDRPDVAVILALLPPPEGLGLAVRDRLSRAGGSRPPIDG